MKKIGILTFHFVENCGAILQCLALSKFLENEGNKVAIINYRPQYLVNCYKIFRKTNKKGLKNNIISFASNIYHLKNRIIKKYKTAKFVEKYLPQTAIFRNSQEIKNAQLNYDVYISGSDQLWNKFLTNNRYDSVYMLNFVGDEAIRCSYAVSNSTKITQQDANELKILLNHFQYISVREESFQNLLQNLLNIPIEVNIDPVFLLKKEEWKNYESNLTVNKSYILIYDLYKQKAVYDFAEELRKQTGFSIIDISCNKTQIKNGAKSYMSVYPADFLYYIDHAAYVITNSFHGTAFSIIYRKKFMTFNSNEYDRRKTDLLATIGLSSRLYNNGVNISEDIDWDFVDRLIENEREKTARYFHTILKN